MIKNNTNINKGFSAVFVIIFTVAIGVVGFAGWFVWNQNQDTNLSSYEECIAQKDSKVQESYPEVCVYKDQRFTKPEQADDKENTSITDSSVSDSKKYLEVEEWGVKFTLVDGMSDAVYTFENYEGQQDRYLWLSKKEYVDLGFCERGFGSIWRFKNAEDSVFNDNTPGISYNEALSKAIKIGDYYYMYTSPQAMCGDAGDIEKWEKISVDTQRLVYDTFKNIETLNEE